jgi:hypothetical protein
MRIVFRRRARRDGGDTLVSVACRAGIQGTRKSRTVTNGAEVKTRSMAALRVASAPLALLPW